ncbi:MAG TPA: UvrD-helicase domain-containing protein [Gemmatimonadaceae bacterium]|nr:UvrD-helicase domain-containing protein [Gemmatimonadaceae bacterium]
MISAPKVSDNLAAYTPHVASPSQRAAIESNQGPVLVLAGPGAGKTYCLIERIRFLIEKHQIDPARICVFTFTNKAAGEIASRLEKYLGERAERVKRGTIHSFCAELLREFAEQVGLRPGFGIADEDYQLSVLHRIEGFRKYHSNTLTCFTAHRFHGDPLRDNDATLYMAYCDFLGKRNLVDFDMLVLKAAQLMRVDSVAAEVRARWDCILVDEFQDLNRAQYAIVRSLAFEHNNVFAVGDDEQSIFSWTGANPKVFTAFLNNFKLSVKAELGDNRRCPSEVMGFARRLLAHNTPLFGDRRHADALRSSPFQVHALTFDTDASEISWILADLSRDREANALEWGDFALLYCTHEIGYSAESGFLSAGVPCRMAQGRALSEDPVVRYLIAALRVILDPDDPLHKEAFLRVVLPKPLIDGSRAKADEENRPLLEHLEYTARRLPKEDSDRRKIWRGFFALQNLVALGSRHTEIRTLADEVLSQRVGEYRTVLEENHDELSDPAESEEVRKLAAKLESALDISQTVWLPRLGGVEIALKGILAGIGLTRVELGGLPPPEALPLDTSDAPELGLSLALFKAAQLNRSALFSNRFRDFTAVDLETTDKNVARAEIVEVAAVRVRNGRIVAEFHSLVKPRVPIGRGASRTHKLFEADVADAPYFEQIWEDFREFCGRDIIVAHNGYEFDFPILKRMSEALAGAPLCTYDTLVLARELHASSARLPDLARLYGIDTGGSHRALADTRCLAHVFLALGETKVARARKTALDTLLDYLGVALALCEEDSLCAEAVRLKTLTRLFPFGRYSKCLEFYGKERDNADDHSIPTLDDLIARLGGERLMDQVRADKTAGERYPAAMLRIGPLLDLVEGKPLAEQIGCFLERVTLSKTDGYEPERTRVNLLTLHSTKGLEFSRVYIVGAEDTQLLRKRDPTKRDIEEARRLLYVGMTRTKDRLVLTRVDERSGQPTGGHRFLDEMELAPCPPPLA